LGSIIDVPIPRPRDRVTIVNHQAYAGIQQQLVDLLVADHGEVCPRGLSA
jgi:hypothetical protein